MKKILCVILVLCVGCFSITARAEMETSAQSCILVETLTGLVLYEKKADAVMPMASTTKLFTALMVRERCRLDEVVMVSEAAASTEGSSAHLQPGERITVEHLLYALLLSSGNDAAEALAEYAGGERPAFIDYMNQRAQELGLSHTYFTNPSGLPDESHVTTARELSQIGRMAQKDPVIARIVGTESIYFTSESGVVHSYTNHNSLLRMYDYATGMKTGYTKAAGRCLVSSATKDGITLICVTLRDPNDWQDHIRLLDFGFSNLSLTTYAVIGSVRESVRVGGGASSSVAVYNSMPINLPDTGEGLSYEMICQLPALVFAPITKGQVLGMAEIRLNGERIATYDLCAAADVPIQALVTKSFQTEWQRICNFLLL